ncbi:hypothetical protein D6D04_02726 [Aureobasidium pullulans]|nr:hypothetical protein D6D04_02726 [Aureobasidium pullulans]
MAAHNVAPLPPTPAELPHALSRISRPAKNWLINNLIRVWNFASPTLTSQPPANTRQYVQGLWLPVPQSHDMIPFSTGGSGIIHVWVCVDHNGNIRDRVVVKNSFPGLPEFQDRVNWTNGVVGGEPIESSVANRIHARLEANNAGDGKYVAECLGWSMILSLSVRDGPYADNRQGDILGNPAAVPILGNPPAATILPQFKLYYEYMLGDLWYTIREQEAGTKLVKRPSLVNRTRVELPAKPFPEGFLWMLFEALAKVAVAMDDEQILHGDLHTNNGKSITPLSHIVINEIVFLGHPNPNFDYAIWPIPKVSDFGSSRDLTVAAVRNRLHQGSWQRNATAPEMDRGAGGFVVNQFTINNAAPVPPTNTPARFSRKTNIYQLGLIMLSALRAECTLEETEWRNAAGSTLPVNQQLGFAAPRTPNPLRMRLQGPEMANYSPHLFRLVGLCLELHPVNRPTPAALLAEVQLRMAGRDGGMRLAKGRFPHNHSQGIRRSVADKYKIGKKPFKPEKVP